MGIINAVTRSVWQRRTTTVPASSTVVVDQVVSYQSVSYIMTFSNSAESAYKSFSYDLVNSGGTLLDKVYNKTNGGNASLVIDAVDNAGITEIRITNNETHELGLDLARLVLN